MDGSGKSWYVKIAGGREYGPVDAGKLASWAREGRLDSDSLLSSDRQNWSPASRKPELGMDWVVEIKVGQYCGPMHRDVLDDLQAKGEIPRSARVYRLSAPDSPASDLQGQVNALKRMMAEAQARADGLEQDLAKSRSRAEKLERELAAALAKAEKKNSAPSNGILGGLFAGHGKTPDLSLLEAAARHELMAARQKRGTPAPQQTKPREIEVIDIESV